MRLIDADKLETDLKKAISKNKDMNCLDFLRAASIIDAQPTVLIGTKRIEKLAQVIRSRKALHDLNASEAALRFGNVREAIAEEARAKEDEELLTLLRKGVFNDN